MYIPRILNLEKALRKKSYFLFGPRQTGKTSLIRHSLKGCRFYNLLDAPTFLKLSHSPEKLSQEVSSKDKIVVIDEIQKLPGLLDQIQILIEEKGIHFLLTGSSARKLRRGGVNLLGGRARSQRLHPLTYYELAKHFDLLKALNFGLIPSIYFSDAPKKDLESYASNYLKEEIAAEGLTRNVPAFSRFLEVAALCHGQLINYTQVASDAQVARSTVQEYFQILQDTLIADKLHPWRKTLKRKSLSTDKLYFFDVGVVRFLQHRLDLQARSPEFGDAFETFLFHELKAFIDYQGTGSLSYWRSQSGFEVDFVLNDRIGIEVKARETLRDSDLKGLKAIREEKLLKEYILVNLEEEPSIVDGIQILPWREFLNRLWKRKLL